MSEKLEDLNYLQLDHRQIGYVNKAEEFWKDVQTTFLNRKDLLYMYNRGHINSVGNKKVKE